MTTVRQVCTRALRRAGVVGGLEDPSAEDAAATLALLNEMVDGWAGAGVDVLKQADYTLDDAFTFWVPPVALEASTIDVLNYRGTWNASTNTPTLASAAGTEGNVYRVSVAGSTVLDDVSSWAVTDYAVYDGTEWLKSVANQRFDGGVIAMLCLKVCGEFGVKPPDDIVIQARSTWSTMLPYYAKPPNATIDLGIRSIPSRTTAVSLEEF